MKLFNLAWRHLIRNWRRTLVTTAAMSFAGTVMILFAALMEGMLQSFERNAVTMSVGEIQIHAAGYRDDPDLYRRIELSEGLKSQLTEIGFYSTSRLYGFGLVAAESSSSGIQLRGIDPLQEKRVTQVHQHVLKGRWLDVNEPSGVVIGKKLARTLNVSVGDQVLVLTQASDGSMADALFDVRGILKSVGDTIDRSGFYLLDSRFRELMVLPLGVHEIALQRINLNQSLPFMTEETKKHLQLQYPEWEVHHWQELLPVIARILEMADVQTLIMILITYVAVAMVVLNAMLMSIFERIREFGVMKALGVSPRKLLMLIYTESILQALLACFIAMIVGIGLASYFQSNGIDLTVLGGGASIGGVAMDSRWRAALTLQSVLMPVGFLFLMVLVAVTYPAFKAARLKPVEAINFH